MEVTITPIQFQLDVALYLAGRTAYETLSVVNVTRPHWVLSHILDGQVRTESAGEVHQVHKGHMMIHPPGVPFSEVAPHSGVHEVLHLDGSFADRISLFREFPLSPVVRLCADDAYSRLFSGLIRVQAESGSAWQRFRATTLVLQLLEMVIASWYAGGATPRPTSYSTDEDRFYNLVQHLRTHFAQPVQRADLADIVHLHPNYLDRVFSSIFGQTPMQMLRDIRLREAQRLLASSVDGVDDIAYHCGFADVSYFSRTFRRTFGMTPSAYRRGVKTSTQSYIPPY